MNNALLLICGLVVAALAALFAVPHFVDWTSYRSVFEEQATRVLGREVRVSGDVNLRLLPSPYVEFERIRIAEDAGRTGEPLFRADRFTMWLSVPPLLRGVLEAREVTLTRPVLRLAVDTEGQGNWRTLSLNRSDLPFIPAGVALQSVKITKGSILVAREGGEPLGRIDAINGELSAEALDGPYKFHGTVKWGEGEREVRLATAKADPDGGVRLKTSLRGGPTGSEYVLDGKITDIEGRPRLTGDLTAKLALEADRLAFAPQGQVLAERPAFDLKAKIEGGGAEVALREITLSFESVGQPQLITGEGKANWSEAPSLDLTLASRWLDLDRIAGATEGTPPLEVGRVLLAALVGAMPNEARTATTFSVDQVALGGEAVSRLAVALVRSEGPLRLERFTAGMPGGARIDLAGELSPSQEAPAFKGRVTLHGANLGRFLAWATRTANTDNGHVGGSFALHGDIDATPGGVGVTNAVAELAGMPVAGNVRYQSQGRRSLDVEFEGRAVNLGQLWPGLDLKSVGGWLLAGGGDATADGSRPQDVRLKVRLAELVAGATTLRDLDAALSVEASKLAIQSFSFKTADSLSFGVDGAVEGLGQGPRGTLRWTLEAPSRAAVMPFVQFAGADPLLATLLDRLATLAPMRLAGSVNLGERAAASADIAIDGTAKGGRLTASARLDGGLAGWREAMAEGSVTIETPDIDPLSRELASLPPRASQAGTPPQPRPGRLLFAAVGVPARGLATTASLDVTGSTMDFSGNLTLEPSGAMGGLAGQLTVASGKVGDVLALAGLTAAAARDFPIDGRVDIARTEAGLTLDMAGLNLGASAVSGRVTLSDSASGAKRFDAELDVSSASMRSLFSIVTADAVPVAGEPLAGEPGVWPSEPFEFTALDGIEGRVSAGFGTLDIGGGLALSAAKIEAELSPRGIAITKLDGTALGGALGSAVTLEKEAAGVSLKGALRLSGAELRAFSRGAGSRAASGSASLDLSFSGRALSPSALVAALAGSGKIELKSARVAGLTPAGVGAATDSVLLGRAPGKGEGLVKALRAGLGQGELPLGSREIPLEIIDGAARVKNFVVEADKGRTAADITVDLATFEVDSEWRVTLDQAARNPPRPPLPPITVVYVGPLATVGDLEPRITAEAFERELAVRRLERDVDELERLRKEDEERTRAETERQKALEAARAANAEPAESGWTPSTAPATGETAPPAPDMAQDGAPPKTTTGSAPPPRRGLTNAAPPRPRKPPPTFNPWSQFESPLQN